MSEWLNSKVVPFKWKVSVAWYRNICLCLCVSGVEARRLCVVQGLRTQRPRHAEVQSRQQAGAELLCPARRHQVLLLLQRSVLWLQTGGTSIAKCSAFHWLQNTLMCHFLLQSSLLNCLKGGASALWPMTTSSERPWTRRKASVCRGFSYRVNLPRHTKQRLRPEEPNPTLFTQGLCFSPLANRLRIYDGWKPSLTNWKLLNGQYHVAKDLWFHSDLRMTIWFYTRFICLTIFLIKGKKQQYQCFSFCCVILVYVGNHTITHKKN